MLYAGWGVNLHVIAAFTTEARRPVSHDFPSSVHLASPDLTRSCLILNLSNMCATVDHFLSGSPVHVPPLVTSSCPRLAVSPCRRPSRRSSPVSCSRQYLGVYLIAAVTRAAVNVSLHHWTPAARIFGPFQAEWSPPSVTGLMNKTSPKPSSHLLPSLIELPR